MLDITVVGKREADDTWARMRTVWDVCTQMGVEVPGSVLEFFNHEAPDANGVCMDLADYDAVSPVHRESGQGVVIDMDKLPSGLRWIEVRITA